MNALTMAPQKTTELVDKIAKLRQKRDVLASMMDEQIEFLRQQLASAMAIQHISEVRGEVGYAYKRRTKNIKATDWVKLQAYIKKHDAFDLLQKRLTESAVEARVAAGETIDGVEIGPEHSTIVVKVIGDKE